MNREQTVKPRILIVENENVTALDMATTLKNAGYDVTSIVASGEEAVNRSLLENPDLVLMDIMLNGKMNGIEAGRIINSEADIPIIYLTAFENHKLPDRTELSSSYGYVSKPFTERELCTNVEIALYKSVLSRKIVRLNKALQVIRKVDRHIARVRDRNLLIRDTCDIFTREKAYNSAWIALPDEAPGTSDHAMLYAGAGVINQDPGGFLRLMEKGNYPFCVSLAHKLPLDNNAIIVSPLNPGHCNCPLHCNDRQGQALTARLILDNNRFGFICVSLPDNTPIGDSEISLFKDVVQDISFALHTIKMEERRSQTEMEIKRVNRALKVISESDKALVHESDETALLKKICRIIADSGGYRLAWAGYAENDPEKSIQPVAVAGDRDYISALDISWGDNKKGQCPAGFAVRSGKPFIVNDPSSVYWCGCDSQLGYQSYIALPLVYQQQTFGTLNIYADEPDAFGKEEVSLLSGLADDLAYGIDVLRTRADRIVAEDLLKDYYKNIEFLSQNIPELIGLSFDDNIYHFLGEKLSELVDNAVILINSYNKNDNIMEICEVFGLGFQSQKLANLTGFSIKPALEKLLTGNKLEALPGELLFHGLSGRGLPGLNGFAIGFTKEGELFGSAVILLENSMELKNKEVIETFIHQASIILHRRHIEKELKESENKFRSLAEISPNAILIHRGREILYANSAATTITGFSREELMRMNFWEILSPQFRKPREKIGTQMLEGKGLPGRAEVMVKMKTGDLCWVELFSKRFDFAGEPAVLLTAVDIHEIKSAREKEKSYRDQLMQADKMIALGTLVSGVAHEINNPNNAIIINTPLLMDFWKNLKPIVDEHYEQQGNFDVGAIPYSDIPEAFSHLFEGIIDSSKRIKTIVDDLKNFARPNHYDQLQAVDVNDVVKQSAALLANMIRKATGNFKTEYFNELPTVNGNSQQLQQVVINLLQNACQAIQNSTQGIVVSTSCVTEKKIVIVTVKDEGEGIARKNIKYLSDPFFTTKRESGGTGLGLSVSSRIIEDHGGSLVVESEPGKGSVFKLILPFTVGDTETGNAASERSTKEKSKKEKLTGDRRRKERRAEKKHVKKTL